MFCGGGLPDLYECWASLDGIRMRYLVSSPSATRHPLLLIHGLLGYSFSWRFNLARLASCAQVYAVDLPGLGFSERPRQMDRTMRGIARHLLSFLDSVGIGQADLLGTSHGGAIAMMLAAAAPDRVRRLVLVAPVNPWSRHGDWLTRALATTAGGLLFRCAAPCLSPLNRYLLQRLYGDPRRIAPGTLEGYNAALKLPGTMGHLLGIVRSWQADVRELEKTLPRIRHVPTQLIWGSRDRAVWPTSAEPLKRQFCNAELVILEGAGHMPYEETPEQFNRAVTDFLCREISP